MPRNADSFAAAFFRDWRALEAAGSRAERLRAERRRGRSPSEQLDRLIESDAAEAWTLVLALVGHAPSEAGLAYVAAGPIETLLTQHGAEFGDRIVQEAGSNARFRAALNYVWGWDRVAASVRNRLLPLLDRDVAAFWGRSDRNAQSPGAEHWTTARMARRE